MIITVVCDVLGEETNGQTVAAMNLIRTLQEKGHDVRILCADQNKKGQEGYYVAPVLSLGKVLNNYIKKVGVVIAKTDEKVLRSALEGADHVHIMVPLILGMAATKMAKEMGISTTAGFHMQAENFTSHIKLNKFGLANKAVYKFIYKKCYRYMDLIHYNTNQNHTP